MSRPMNIVHATYTANTIFQKKKTDFWGRFGLIKKIIRSPNVTSLLGMSGQKMGPGREKPGAPACWLRGVNRRGRKSQWRRVEEGQWRWDSSAFSSSSSPGVTPSPVAYKTSAMGIDPNHLPLRPPVPQRGPWSTEEREGHILAAGNGDPCFRCGGPGGWILLVEGEPRRHVFGQVHGVLLVAFSIHRSAVTSHLQHARRLCRAGGAGEVWPSCYPWFGRLYSLEIRSVTASGCCVSYTFPSSGLVMFDFSLGVMGWGGGDGLFLNSSFSSSLLHDWVNLSAILIVLFIFSIAWTFCVSFNRFLVLIPTGYGFGFYPCLYIFFGSLWSKSDPFHGSFFGSFEW